MRASNKSSPKPWSEMSYQPALVDSHDGIDEDANV